MYYIIVEINTFFSKASCVKLRIWIKPLMKYINVIYDVIGKKKEFMYI